MTAFKHTAILKIATALVFLFAAPLLFSACQPCSKHISISANIAITTIIAPPGGGPRQEITVTGVNFTPNAPITLTFSSYPATNSDEDHFERSTVADAAGSFEWQASILSLPSRDFNAPPEGTFAIAARETNGSCFAATTIKNKRLLRLF